jgi:hypothetical protein
MRSVFACTPLARFLALGAVLAALIPLAAGCSDVQITPGAAAGAGSSASSDSSSSVGGSGGVGGSSSTGGAPSDGGAGGGGGSIVIPSTAWAIGAGSPDTMDFGMSVAVDAAGEVFVTGAFNGTLDLGAGPLAGYLVGGAERCFMAKFGPSGEPLWAKSVPSYKSYVAVGAQGSLWMTGATLASEYLGDSPSQQQVNGYFLARYTLDGELLWATSIAQQNEVMGTVVVPTSNGGAVVLGMFGPYSIQAGGLTISTTSLGVDIFAIAVDSAGKTLWGRALGADLAVKPDASLSYGFVGAGIKGGGLVIHAGLNTLKLDSKGKTVWTKSPGGTASDHTRGAGIALAPGGDILIAGQLLNGQSATFGAKLLAGPTTYVARLDPQGNAIWGTSVDHDLRGIAADPTGVVSVAVVDNSLQFHVDLVRLSPAGKVLSTHSWSEVSAGGSTFALAAVAVDHGGNALITGAYVGSVDFGTGALPQTSTSGTSYTSNVFIAKLVP